MSNVFTHEKFAEPAKLLIFSTLVFCHSLNVNLFTRIALDVNEQQHLSLERSTRWTCTLLATSGEWLYYRNALWLGVNGWCDLEWGLF